MRVDLLDPPSALLKQPFDLVFSFGVLHHTGNTWKALDNVSALVGTRGALFLYLYGAESWSPEHKRELENIRQALASLSFEEKLMELQRRFPGDDPHQMFDLMSPTINDRVRYHDASQRLLEHGFARIDHTVESTEIYLRATRADFPAGALLPPVAGSGRLATEVSRRSIIRRGLGFERVLRNALLDVPKRTALSQVLEIIRQYGAERSVVDVSLPPDALDDQSEATLASAADVVHLDGSPPTMTADVVLHLGAAMGACRFPRELLMALWTMVRAGGTLIVELPSDEMKTDRTTLDRLRDCRLPVPGKIGAMLRRHADWTTGQGLHAVGGRRLLNALDAGAAATLLRESGAARVERVTGRSGSQLLVSVRFA
jgi:hypothetical protein